VGKILAQSTPTASDEPTIPAIAIHGLSMRLGRPITVGELAALAPKARIDGKGAPLSAIACTPLGAAATPGRRKSTLADAWIDKAGDLRVTPAFPEVIAKHAPNLLTYMDDELPVLLDASLSSAQLQVRNPEQIRFLKAAGFAPSTDRTPEHEALDDTEDGLVDENASAVLTIDLANLATVHAALDALGVRADSTATLNALLSRYYGGAVPESEQAVLLRRALLVLLDHPDNHVKIADELLRLPNSISGPDADAATLYASVRVNQAHLEDVIVTYKRFNNQSYAGQGSWWIWLLGLDQEPFHEFDNEVAHVALDRETGRLNGILTARHAYGQYYNADQVARHKEAAGRERWTLAVSSKAHGGRLAEAEEQYVCAGHTEDGVRWWDPRDHVVKDMFPGFRDTVPVPVDDATEACATEASGGSATPKAWLTAADKLNVISEHEDPLAHKLETQMGADRPPLFGLSFFARFGRGVHVYDRGTQWFYTQRERQMAA
jgi:hypothetical protein